MNHLIRAVPEEEPIARYAKFRGNCRPEVMAPAIGIKRKFRQDFSEGFESARRWSQRVFIRGEFDNLPRYSEFALDFLNRLPRLIGFECVKTLGNLIEWRRSSGRRLLRGIHHNHWLKRGSGGGRHCSCLSV